MRTLSILLILSLAPLVATAAGQDTIEEAKAHYAAAAYEEALSTLGRADAAAPSSKVELEQYRAFCFIALGRITDAERAVASLVAADPQYVPSPTVASPKVLQLVSEMRRKELPGVVRKLLDEGRTEFKKKQFAESQKTFDLLLQLLEDPALKGRPENADLRVLAEGFVALADATAQPEPEVPETAVRTTGTTVVEPPVAIQQPLPDWIPPDNIAASRDFVGAIKVTIGIDGRVKAASIEKATYPTYDARLLQVSRQWVYKPAMRDGEPVESEKVIAVQLRRRD